VLAPARALDKLRWKLRRPPKSPVRVTESGKVAGTGVVGRALTLVGRANAAR
jgi:hypothetical protein